VQGAIIRVAASLGKDWEDGCKALSLLYLFVRALLGVLVRSRRGLDVKDIELMVLRHELEVLRRQIGRPTFRLGDRALLAAAACHLPHHRPGGQPQP
jgi:hypothetical protein